MSAMIGLMTAAEQLTQEQGRATTKEGRCSWYEESCKMGSCVGKNRFFFKTVFYRVTRCMLKGAHPDDDDVVLCWTSARKARSFSILEEARGAFAEDHDWTDSTWMAALLPGMDLVFDASRAV